MFSDTNEPEIDLRLQRLTDSRLNRRFIFAFVSNETAYDYDSFYTLIFETSLERSFSSLNWTGNGLLMAVI